VGYDLNDPMWWTFEVVDAPATTQPVTYGFEVKRESTGTGVLYVGRSAGDNAAWGFSSDVLLTAEERFPVGSSPHSKSHSLSQFVYKISEARTTVDSTSFVEVDSDYRVTLIPKSTTGVIRLRFQVPTNPFANYAANTIYTFRTFRTIGGITTYGLTSAGDASGSRNAFAGRCIRPVGFDANDPMFTTWDVVDEPGTLSAVTYGFTFKRESGGSGNLYFGYSGGDNADNGWSAPIVITAEEFGSTEGDNALVQSVVTSSATRASGDTKAFAEASSDYRVTITPASPSSLVRLRYQVPGNAAGPANLIYSFRAFRMVGGVATSALASHGSLPVSLRLPVSHQARPVGYDANDPMWATFAVLDLPGTTEPVTYGFEWKHENDAAGTYYFGYSNVDQVSFGFTSDVVIVAEEIAV
jgi:hypothetical protein